MELPKNITQIGEADKSFKIYVEDYVMSYLKQMNRFAEDKEIGIALYGRCSEEQELTYCFIYGACKLNFLQREVRHFSQAQIQEMEKLRRKYFPECELVGYVMLKGEMIEGINISTQNGCRYIKGYACFYEKNDNMLGYMLDNRVEDAAPETTDTEKYEHVRMRQEERKKDYVLQEAKEEEKPIQSGSLELEKRMNGMKFAAAGMFVLLCMVSVVTVQSEGIGDEFSAKVKKLIGREMERPNIEADATEVMSNDVINTLVAEEQLAAAIQQENQLTNTPSEADGQVSTETPVSEQKQETIPIENPVSNTTQNAVEDSASNIGQTTMPVDGLTSDNPISTTMPTEGTAQNAGQVPISAETFVSNPEQTLVPSIAENTTPVPTQTPIPTEIPVPTQAPTAVPVQSEQTFKTYVIRSGDTLIGISSRLYGSEEFVYTICELNDISNPDNIKIGQKILLP